MTRAPGTLRLALRVARYRPWRYVAGVVMWVTWWTLPALSGLVLKGVFDAISADAPGAGVPALIGALVTVEAARIAVFWPAVIVFTRWWMEVMAWLRGNLLSAQLASGGADAGPPVGDAGAAVPVFRDDVREILLYCDAWLDLAGTLIFAVIALAVMAAVDPVVTLVVALPLVVVTGITQVLARRIRATRHADRRATADVTGFLGSAFAAVLALKVAGAEDRAVAELARRNRRRSSTALRDRLLTDSLHAFSASTVEVTVGMVLLLVASSMRAGTFTVGDLVLFTSYLAALSALPRWLGTALTRHRHAQVSFARMAELLPSTDPAAAVVHRPLRLSPAPALRPRPRPAPLPPADVRVSGLCAALLRDVDLHLPPGSFTVVTGPVGSGKSTLLRAVLGLVPMVAGRVTWDGVPVADLAAHMVPPRAAYVPQVPRLFTGTLEENLTLGVGTAPEALSEVVRRAAFDTDLAAMPAGLATAVGARGVRLSGGQLQRVATARALAAAPALLVLDDLSSALDARTERAVWERLRAATACTCLVVSHRPAALERADRVVVLRDGRVVAAGTPAELRARGLDPLANDDAG